MIRLIHGLIFHSILLTIGNHVLGRSHRCRRAGAGAVTTTVGTSRNIASASSKPDAKPESVDPSPHSTPTGN
ncbi:MAG: hypothetical protein R2856_17150 [Caldilineaceae bacterium]